MNQNKLQIDFIRIYDGDKECDIHQEFSKEQVDESQLRFLLNQLSIEKWGHHQASSNEDFEWSIQVTGLGYDIDVSGRNHYPCVYGGEGLLDTLEKYLDTMIQEITGIIHHSSNCFTYNVPLIDLCTEGGAIQIRETQSGYTILEYSGTLNDFLNPEDQLPGHTLEIQFCSLDDLKNFLNVKYPYWYQLYPIVTASYDVLGIQPMHLKDFVDMATSFIAQSSDLEESQRSRLIRKYQNPL